MLVDEVEPEPSVNVAVGWLGDDPMAVQEGDASGIALRGVRKADQDVPRSGDGEEDEQAGQRVQLSKPSESAAGASSHQQMKCDDSMGKTIPINPLVNTFRAQPVAKP